MAHQEDKQRTTPKATTASPEKSTKNTTPVPGKDPDVYDPVGMAGKKAGIVEEVEKVIAQDARDDQKTAPTKPAEGREGA